MIASQPPDISIVTCSYNQRQFLETTILSVFQQSNVNAEYIVIDGKSSDGSATAIEKYSSWISYWVSESDSGQSDALNKGLRRATGDIVGWLCSDDILLPDALQKVVKFFKQHPEVDAVYGNAVLIDTKGNNINPKKEINFYPWMLIHDHNYIPQPAMFWRRKLHEKVGYLREDLHLTMDLDLWLRFAKNQCKVLHVGDYFAAIRRHDLQKIFTQPEALAIEIAGLRATYESSLSKLTPSLLSRSAARAARIGLKLLDGGYSCTVPATISDILRKLHSHS